MKGIFRKSLGVILLFATIGLASCQTLFNTITKAEENITIKKL